ncbi:predicted protein [Streptomyces sp. SPB78]|nr:predicted protein [Streptomyces sp. SPB78]
MGGSHRESRPFRSAVVGVRTSRGAASREAVRLSRATVRAASRRVVCPSRSGRGAGRAVLAIAVGGGRRSRRGDVRARCEGARRGVGALARRTALRVRRVRTTRRVGGCTRRTARRRPGARRSRRPAPRPSRRLRTYRPRRQVTRCRVRQPTPPDAVVALRASQSSIRTSGSSRERPRISSTRRMR